MGRNRAFSLLELAIVTVIIGIIAAIAVPRFSRGAASARESAIVADLARLQSAIDRYTAEHCGLSPGHDAPGSASSDGDDMIERLLERTDELGTPEESGFLGPYLRMMPINPFNGLRSVRIGGGAAGANTHGWRFDPLTLVIQPDHGDGVIDDEVVIGEGEVVGVGGLGGGKLGAGKLGAIDAD
jgi:prepilin-type N-terminal cleavage/methylation domain-containing protein